MLVRLTIDRCPAWPRLWPFVMGSLQRRFWLLGVIVCWRTSRVMIQATPYPLLGFYWQLHHG